MSSNSPYSESICLSIVSHGQGRLIAPLLLEIAAGAVRCREIILTLNIPEDESFTELTPTLPIRVLRNANPKGFGANHNAAFEASSSDFFVVVNPDIRLQDFDMAPLLALLSDPANGLAAPAVHSSTGELQDSARQFPTLRRLVKRKLGRSSTGPDYTLTNAPISVDWVAGMFMVMRRTTYQQIGGFDDRFFMYFEDVDLCRRLRKAKLNVVLAPQVRVIHDAQRASRRHLKHFVWHVSSAARYLLAR